MKQATIKIGKSKFHTFFKIFKDEKEWIDYKNHFMKKSNNNQSGGWTMNKDPIKIMDKDPINYPCMIIKTKWNGSTRKVYNEFLYS